MKRSRFRQLNSQVGTPTRESQRSERPRRSEFRQLTHGNRIIRPIPYIGRIYRTVYANSIADYEGISNASWSVGTTGATNNFNCFYFHQIVANQRSTVGEWVLNPIRWIVDVPGTAGGSYDHWNDYGDAVTGFASDNRLEWTVVATPGKSIGGSGAIAFSSTWMTANSHCNFGQNIARVNSFPEPLRGQTNRASSAAWVESALQSIAPTTQIIFNWDSCVLLDVALMRFRVNGTVIATKYENITIFLAESSGLNIPNANKGDTIDIDIWYRIRKKAFAANPTNAGKFVYYLQTTRVSNGSRRMWPPPSDTGLSNNLYAQTNPLIEMGNVDMSPSFNRNLQTYNVTIAGHTGWTLKDGSDGPHKMASSGGWTKTVGAGFIRWNAPAGQLYCQSLELRYDAEIPYIIFTTGTSIRAATGTDYIFYRPQNSGDYATSSVSKEYGNVNHAPCGVFNQAGTTTFSLVTFSQLPQIQAPNRNPRWPFDARRAGGFLPTFMEVPTTITLTRTNI